MGPPLPQDFKHYYTKVNGIKIHYVMEGNGPKTIVLCHGWPDLWYGWRYQIKALASGGYRVIVPDMRGFGQTQAPEGYENYTMKDLTQDMASLLDALDIQKAVFIGHDWGGEVVWKMCLYHPDRVLAVAALCTPYTPRHSEFIPLEEIVKTLPIFGYQIYLTGPNAAKQFSKDTEKFFRAMMRSSSSEDRIGLDLKNSVNFLENINPSRSKLLSQEELDYYTSEYQRSGFQGGLNWYKTRKLNWENEANLARKIDHNALMVTAGKDAVLTPAMTHRMEQFMKNLSRAHVEEASHWVQVEQHQEVNRILLSWLSKVTNDNKL